MGEVMEVIYNAALERAYIRSQQRPPDHDVPRFKFTRATVATQRAQVANLLQAFPRSWTVLEMADELGLDEHKAYHALEFWVVQGHVRRCYPGRGHRGRPQRYQWRGQEKTS